MIYFQGFRITGVANKIVYDEGLKSTPTQKKRLLSVIIQVSSYQDNDVQGWYMQEKIFDIPDKLLDTTEREADANTNKSMMRLNEIEVGIEIPVGEIFKVAIKCGAATTDVVGAYRYELY